MLVRIFVIIKMVQLLLVVRQVLIGTVQVGTGLSVELELKLVSTSSLQTNMEIVELMLELGSLEDIQVYLEKMSSEELSKKIMLPVTTM